MPDLARKCLKGQETLSKTYAADWDALSDEEQQPFYDVSDANDILFRRRFPHYHFKKGERAKWVKQTTEYGIHVAHEWSTKNDHLFALDEEGAVVHTPSVIPVTEDACDSQESRSTSPSSSLQSPELAFMDIADEASTPPVVPFHLRYIQAVEYSDQRLLPSCLLYQDYDESATTKPALSTHFLLVPGDDLDMVSALQFNPELNDYEPGDPTPYDYEYYQPPGIASL